MQNTKTTMKRHLWIAAGAIALALGVIGIILPVLPTTPFVLLAAFCFGKGSDKLRLWLTTHPRFGPMIADWERHGAISKKAKTLAASTMAAAFLLSVFIGLPGYVLIIQALCLTGAATFVLSRPTAPR